MEDFLHIYLGEEIHSITWWQMSLRALLIFLFSIVYARIAGMRAFGKKSTFDVLLSILLGAVLAKTIVGSSPFIPTNAATLTMVILYRLLAIICFYSDRLGKFFKGESVVLYSDGKLKWNIMRKHNITRKDIEEALKEEGNIKNLEDADIISLERSGNISVVNKQ